MDKSGTFYAQAPGTELPDFLGEGRMVTNYG